MLAYGWSIAPTADGGPQNGASVTNKNVNNSELARVR